MDIFIEISALLGITTLITVVMRFLKQPLVVGYILAGIIAGPYVLNLLQSTHEMELFSKVGIVLLLFIVGLHLNPGVVKEVGKVSIVAGVGQVTLTAVIGFGLAILLGFERVAALYLAIGLTFSSTIIILKLLADKRDLHKLYAKIIVGVLLVQDIIATFILIGIAILSNTSEFGVEVTILWTLLKGFSLFIFLMLVSKHVLPRVTKFVAHSQELLFLFSLTWGIGLASLFLLIGFSIEIGALVAGVTLSSTAYADEMASRLKPLRDFFIILFFILLGSQMALSNLQHILLPAVIFSFFVMVGNPIIVVILMNLLGFSRRTGFLASLTVAQISEFSLILATLGMQVGHVSQETLSLITLIALITITGSSYLIMYGEKIYPRVIRFLEFFQFVKKTKKQENKSSQYAAVLFGFDRVGHDFVQTFYKLRLPFFVVDFNPHSIAYLEKQNITSNYGDATDVEFLEDLPLDGVKLSVSTIPDVTANLLIIQQLKDINPRAITVTIAHTIEEAQELYEAGASYVVLPHHLGAKHAAELIEEFGLDKKDYERKRESHLKLLERSHLGVT